MDKLDTEIHTRPTPLRGAADYPMRCARKAATVPNLRQGGHEELKERVKKKLRKIRSNIDPKIHYNLTLEVVLEPFGDSLGGLGVSGGAS